MSEKQFLIFDIGASSGRSIVGKVLNNSFQLEETYRFKNGPISVSGSIYWDALNIFSEIKNALHKSVKSFPETKTLAIDTWGCDFAFIDKKGQMIANPYTYREPKRHAVAEKLHALLPKSDLYNLSGAPLDRIMSIYQLFSFRQEKSPEFNNGSKFLMIPDLMNYFLTGEISNEFTNATMTLLVNQKTRNWETSIMKRLEFNPDWFSLLSEAGTSLGEIKNEISSELDIKNLEVIIPATHDTASAISGIPVDSNLKTGSWAFISMGTWCICGIETNSPIISTEALLSGFGNEGASEGKNLLVRNLVGLWVIQECKKRWETELNRGITWDEIIYEVKNAKEIKSYIDIDDPRFSMVQLNMPSEIQKFCTETNQIIPNTIGEIAKCFYESLVLKFRNELNKIEKLTKSKLEVLHLVGGGIENKLLCRWISEVTSLPVIAGPTETTSVGNLIFQMKNQGIISNVREGREFCKNSFNFENYIPSNSQIWNDKFNSFSEKINNVKS
jgi:sugar (pentulose or hexulose) kinase